MPYRRFRGRHSRLASILLPLIGSARLSSTYRMGLGDDVSLTPIDKKEAGYYFVVQCVAAGGALDCV